MELRSTLYIFLLLFSALLATSLPGVAGEVEDGEPLEAQCRPYVEQALKKLETGETPTVVEEVDETSREVDESRPIESETEKTDDDGQASEEHKSTEQVEAIKDGSQETDMNVDDQSKEHEETEESEPAQSEDETSKEAEADKSGEEQDTSTETGVVEESQEAASAEKQESEKSGEVEQQTSTEQADEPAVDSGEESKQTEGTEEEAQAEDKSQEVTDEKEESGEKTSAEQQDKEQFAEAQENASVEKDDQISKEDGEEVKSKEETEDVSAEGDGEKAAEDSIQSEEVQDGTEGKSEEQAETSGEKTEDASAEQKTEDKQEEDSKEMKDEESEQADKGSEEKDVESQEQVDAESHEQKDAESKEQVDADSQEQKDTESKEQTDADSQEQTNAESQEQADAKSQEQTDAESQEQKDANSQEQKDADSQEQKDADSQEQKDVESKEQKDDESQEQKGEVDSNEQEQSEKSQEDTDTAGSAEKTDSSEKKDDSEEKITEQADGSAEEQKEDSAKSAEVDESSKEEIPAESEEGTEAASSDEQTEKTNATSETFPEEDLMQAFDIPTNLRSRSHISQLLHLDDESNEVEKVINKAADGILKDLKRIYENAIKPLETLYKYRDLSNRHFGDPEIFSKPLVLFMGPWSGGKSSIINYLLDNEYTVNSLRTGAEPSPAYFNIVMWGEQPEMLDGTQLAADWTFSGLQKFGQGLEERLKGLKLPNKLLEKVNIVEIPGILEVRKQVSRVFPFNDACQWFIDRADIIFLVYDPSKLDVGPETEAILDQLKGREYQTRILLNKADQVKSEELIRVQGALIWNISPLMSSAQPPVMYLTSLWSRPYEEGAPARLLQAQERAFLRDIKSAVDKRIENKIASARRFAVRVRNHAKMVDCYLTTYYNHKSVFANRKLVADQIIEHPQDYHIYEGLSTLTNISRYDLPDPDVYRDFFRLNPLYEFQQLAATCTYFRGCPINRLDIAIAYDFPELVGKYKKTVEAGTASMKSSDNS